ncbi:hypothetical protein [Qipengyuania vesicularis]|uniref:hypothetical protein n=1 Tax=Qipengyuania vesicularis TaxID=2867232 RepID=UPI001C881237|nr:hypothetical protein [Qipengyuania vesicularis]MBX7527951.1 hypothetical protein [Qipengyuania vesicularis]
MKFRLVAAATASLALAACGSSDNASTEAEADTVEVAADEAMDGVTDEPVADPEAAIEEDTGPTAAETARVEEAADNAAATAEAAMDAMGEDLPE